MQHQLAVCMLDRERDIANQAQTIRERFCVLCNVVEHRHAVDELKHDKGLMLLNTGIEKARNIRVIQPS